MEMRIKPRTNLPVERQKLGHRDPGRLAGKVGFVECAVF